MMAVVRTHHYSVDPADLDDLLTQRAGLIEAVRAAYPGLASTRLTRLEDGSYTDAWCWDTAAQLQAALPATELSAAHAAMTLVRDYTATYGEIIDER
jgi:phage tail protein X